MNIYQSKSQKKPGYFYLLLQALSCFYMYTFLRCQWFYNIEKCFRKKFHFSQNIIMNLISLVSKQAKLHPLKPVKSLMALMRTSTVFPKMRF